MESRILAIDTAGRQVRLEAFRDGRPIAAVRPDSAQHVRELTRHLRQMLAEIEWKIEQVTAIGVNIGPGTFTGIRVGLSVAKALCYTHRIPLVGVDMFDCFGVGMWLNGSWPKDCTELDVLLEGQLQSCSAARYCRHETHVERVALTTFPQSELNDRINEDQVVTGMLERTQSKLAPKTRIVGQPPWDQTRPSIAAIVMQRVAANRFDDPMTIEPFYVRPSSAEEKWDRRSN